MSKENEVNKAIREHYSKIGSKGAKNYWINKTPEERSEIMKERSRKAEENKRLKREKLKLEGE